MPCNDGGDGAIDSEVRKLTAYVCEAMALLNERGLIDELSAELSDWWFEHSDKEASRVRREASLKLTPRERIALGIDMLGRAVDPVFPFPADSSERPLPKRKPAPMGKPRKRL